MRKGRSSSSDSSHNQTIALITGTNRGIGFEVSRRLGALGYKVLLGCRSEARGLEAERQLRAEGMDAVSITLDIASPVSIEKAVESVEQQFGRLDVLVNNAAIHFDSWERASRVDLQIVNEAFEVNTIGPWVTTLAFLPLLKRSPHPRVVNVSSEGGSLASMSGGAPAYSLSKAGLNAVTRMLAADMKADGVLVNSICPGWTATDMGGAGGRPVEEGADGIVWAATLPDSGPTGGFFRDGVPLPW